MAAGGQQEIHAHAMARVYATTNLREPNMAQGQFWLVSSPQELEGRLRAFGNYLLDKDDWPVYWQARPYTHPRSLDQNALLHVWCRHYAEHLLKRQVTDTEVDAMKYTLQRHCYAQTHWDWLLTERKDLFTGHTKPDRRSTTEFDTGQMYHFLEWIQSRAADDSLILESKGEYAELKQGEHA